MTSDYLVINDLEVTCRVGDTEAERAFPQIIFLTIRLFLPLQEAGQTGNIKKTVNYAHIINQIRDQLEKAPFILIESVAEKVANFALKFKQIERVEVSVSKKISPGVRTVGATVLRTRHGSS